MHLFSPSLSVSFVPVQHLLPHPDGFYKHSSFIQGPHFMAESLLHSIFHWDSRGKPEAMLTLEELLCHIRRYNSVDQQNSKISATKKQPCRIRFIKLSYRGKKKRHAVKKKKKAVIRQWK